MGRSVGAKNYKKEVLLEVVKEVLPSGAYEWERVCTLYKERSGESNLHDKDDVSTIFSLLGNTTLAKA